MLNWYMHALVTGFGFGYWMAPGTVATLLVGVPLSLCVHTLIANRLVRSGVIFLSCFLAYKVIEYTLPTFSHEDPHEIVLDEVVGTLCACALGPLTTVSYTVRVVLFRFFDISKMWPVYLGERLPGALGVVSDDIIAGILAHCIALGFGI